METYPEMNDQIVRLLREHDNPACLYAAQRIEELEAEVRKLRCEHCGSHLMRYDGCSRCGAPICCEMCCQVATFEAEVKRLREK